MYRIALSASLLAVSQLSHAGAFDECFEYTRILASSPGAVPQVSEDGLRGDWVINGKAIGCRVDKAGRVVSIITPVGESRREDLVKIAGPSTGKVEFDEASDKAFVDGGVKYLTKLMKDPSSVQWRGVFITANAFPALCGEVNAKNSYGAYVGFRRFYYTRNTQLTEIEQNPGEGVFDKMYLSLCKTPRKTVDIADSSGPAGAAGTVADEIVKLDGLRKQGLITDAEFDSQKRKLLSQ